MKIAISGVTGSFGREALAYLLEKGVSVNDIVALARTPEKATYAKEQGVEVRPADFDNEEQMVEALKGVDKVLLVSTTEPITAKRVKQHTNVIDAAKVNNVEKIVYTSGVNPSLSPLGDAHVQTEEYLKNSGVNYLIIRNNSYLETKLPDVQMAVNSGRIASTVASGRFGLALRKDYAQAAVNAMLSDKVNETITLAGNLTTYAELAATIGKVLNKDVQFMPLTDEQSLAALKERMPEPVAKIFVANNRAIENGFADVTGPEFEELLGRPVTSIEDGLKELVSKLK